MIHNSSVPTPPPPRKKAKVTLDYPDKLICWYMSDGKLCEHDEYVLPVVPPPDSVDVPSIMVINYNRQGSVTNRTCATSGEVTKILGQPESNPSGLYAFEVRGDGVIRYEKAR